MSDYISKSALMDALIYCDGLGRKSLEAVIKTIDEQPTLDEKEIICKAFERVVEMLKRERIYTRDCSEQDHYFEQGIIKAIEIVKKECGISE